mmetsp:Transcript_8098/g.15250  ORF Transcript_8098/g.15250 Transcript_8098/m.15250 type:complete len:293 (+) Transcript_8098:153-1031(+)
MANVSWEEDILLSTIIAMRHKEVSMYRFAKFYKPVKSIGVVGNPECMNIRDDIGCRDKICNWTYSVIDHFELSRQTVAISIDIFDRYMATRGNLCDSNLALLTSLATLYIAIKVNEKKKMKLCTLAKLSRDRFSPQDIELMETEILTSLSWLVHPPTTLDFISHIIKLMPLDASLKTRHDIFDMSRYVAELSVCDRYFVEHHKSTIALATLLNVLEDEISYEEIPRADRQNFLRYLTSAFPWFTENVGAINLCRDRLRHLKWEQDERPLRNITSSSKRARSPTSVLSHETIR